MALIRCECGHYDYDHYKGKCFGFNENLTTGEITPCKCTKAKWVNLFEK